jgi:hypothetical protein
MAGTVQMPAWEAPGRLRFRPVKKAKIKMDTVPMPSFPAAFFLSPLAET